MRVYVSGRVSGRPREEAAEQFAAAATLLRKQGSAGVGESMTCLRRSDNEIDVEGLDDEHPERLPQWPVATRKKSLADWYGEWFARHPAPRWSGDAQADADSLAAEIGLEEDEIDLSTTRDDDFDLQTVRDDDSSFSGAGRRRPLDFRDVGLPSEETIEVEELID